MGRYLKRNYTSRVPTNIIIAACSVNETPANAVGGKIQTLNEIHAIAVRREKNKWTRRKQWCGSNPKEFWEFVASRLETHTLLTVICDDAGRLLTLSDFWEMIDNGIYSLRWCCECGEPAYDAECCGRKVWRGFTVTNDPPTIVSCRNTFGILRILSSNNYWLQGQDREISATNGAIELEQRVCCTMDIWDSQDCGCWQATAASLAWSSFRHMMPEKSLVIDHDETQTAIARRSYYAGQCEAYFVGKHKGTSYKIDATAFYPSIMLDRMYPVSFKEAMLSPRLQDVKTRMKLQCCVADVRMQSENDAYPIHSDDRLLYVRGEFDTSLAGPELSVAIARGHVMYVRAIAWYDAGNPFEQWVRHWWEQRVHAKQIGDKYAEELAKFIHVSLSGKFGAWSVRWKDIDYKNPPERWCEWYQCQSTNELRDNGNQAQVRKLRSRAGWVQELSDPCEGRESCPAIAAYITSYGRCVMEVMKNACPSRSVLYQDTDAIIVTQDGKDELDRRGFLNGSGLGTWRVQQQAEQCEIFAPKDYQMDADVVAAGVKRNAKKIGHGFFEQMQAQRLPGILSHTPRCELRVSKITVKMNRSTSYRDKNIDGWTKPLQINDSLSNDNINE